MPAAIPAHNMGSYFVESELGNVRERETVYEVCPICGGLMTERASKCGPCYNRERSEREEAEGNAQRAAIRRERQPRFDAALAAGWTLAELYHHDEDDDGTDPVPTWGEIAARDMWPAIRSYCRGMTNRKGRQNGT